jgi:hypothetical protein
MMFARMSALPSGRIGGTEATSDEVSAALDYLVALGRVERVEQLFQRREHD